MLGYYILAVSVLASAFVGLLVVSRDIRSATHRIYALLTLFFIALSVVNTLSLNPSPYQFFFMQSVMFSASLGIYLLFLLVVSIGDSNPILKQKRCITLLAASVVVAGIAYTPYMFSDFRAGSPPSPVAGPGIIVFFIHFTFVAWLTAIELSKGLKSKDRKRAKQYKFILIGLLPIIILALLTSLILPIVFNYSGLIVVTPLYVFFLVSCIGYAIVRHGLFDVRVAAVRTLAYAGSLGTLAATYYATVYVISTFVMGAGSVGTSKVNPLDVFLALALAFIFQPVKSFFDKVTNDIFFRDGYDAESLYGSMSRLLASTTDLRGLLERAATTLSSSLKAEQGFFFVYHSGDFNHYVSAGTKDRSYLALADAHALNRYVAEKGDQAIVAELLESSHPIRRLMVSYRIAVVLPLNRAGEVIGYLCLGDHKGSGYTDKDIRVLETLSDELVVAIQNALAVQEIKEMNATLEQKIDVATKELRSSNAQLRHIDEVKDEFMSMASHQLRTPLTSVKGYLSMVLEGDAGKINPQQKQLLEEAFNSSERMVRLISDFLNVSRLQTGKFIIEKAPIDLASIVAQEVSSLQVLASGHSMTIAFDKPKAECMINADEGKVRQVIMNFIDNAIYYSRPNSTITVSLEQIGNSYEVVVADTGIGVPKTEQARLFQKFFRATNARSQRPDGTGVGLFLARKVITAHSGKLIFSSVEGEGSRFGFSLPALSK